MQKGLFFDVFMTMTLVDARSELVSLPHKQILKSLKDHPEGISPEVSDNLKNDGADLSDPKAVGVAMKRGDSITSCIEFRKYIIYSKAIEVALRSYDPTLPAVVESYNSMEMNQLIKVVKKLRERKH